MRSRIRRITIALSCALALIGGATITAPQAEASRLVGIEELSPTVSLVSVYSPSMDRVVRNHVVHPAGKPAAPVFYMLPGAGGAEDGISWYHHGGVREFFSGKRVNVVLPIGGRFSMYTDWQHDDPVLGNNQWRTYINDELPSVIDSAFSTTGANAISGVSMSAGPAVSLAVRAPHRYRAVAAYSGCPSTTSPLGVLTNTAVVSRGGGNVLNMWGPPGSPAWIANDPVTNAGKLRGTAIYLGSASGIPGPVDDIGPIEMAGSLVGGLPIEAVSNGCNAELSHRLNALGIPHRFVSQPLGAHSWGLFRAELRDSWPQIARAIGA